MSHKVTDDDVEIWFAEEEAEAELPAEGTSDPAKKYAQSQLRVVRETKDYQLDYLRHALQPGRELIDTAPAYQRRLRWNRKKRSLLIESFLLNIPVPPIFLYEQDYNEYEVIDGRQRLDTIRDFLSNKFALTGLEYWPELNSKRFVDLPIVLQKGLLRRSLSAVVLLAETRGFNEGGLDVRQVLFDRLNTGGMRLNPQELRNALNPGPFNALLMELARSSPFTEIWGIPPYVQGEELDPPEELLTHPLFSAMADVELVLRYFALKDAIENDRKGALRAILDRFMAANARADDAVLSRLAHDFRSNIERLYQVFEGAPFVLPTTLRPSRPLYDALMIALSQDPKVNLEDGAVQVRKALAEALATPKTYDILVGRGNTMEAIRSRVSLAQSILHAGT